MLPVASAVPRIGGPYTPRVSAVRGYIEGVSGSAFDSLLLLAALAVLGAAGLLLLVHLPRTAVAVYVAALGWAPIWFGGNLSYFYIPVHTVLALTAIAALLRHPGPPLRLTAVDGVLLGVCALILLEYPLGLTEVALPAQLVIEWLPALAVGRIAWVRVGQRFLGGAFLVVFGIAGALAVLEGLTGMNLWVSFVALPNAAFRAWGALQFRAGALRAEGAMGHSIALGCSLAMAVPMLLAARTKAWLRLLGALLVLAGGVATLSRLGMVLPLVGLAAMLLFNRRDLGRGLRAVLGVLLLAAGAAASWMQSTVFAAAGSEATNSAAYRLWLLSLVPSLEPLGQASSFQRSSDKTASFGAFASIDSQVLDLALKVGWVPVAILLALLLLAAARVVLRRADPATTALVVQFPAFLTVAFITQYGMVVWFFAGMAAGAYAVARHQTASDTSSETANPAPLGPGKQHTDVMEPSRDLLPAAQRPPAAPTRKEGRNDAN